MTTFVSTFQRLRWKLTLSYSAVTVSALLVVVLILGSILLSRVLIPLDIVNNSLSPTTWIQIVRNTSTDLFRYVLSQEPIDTELISKLLQEGELQVTFFDLLRTGDLEVQLRTVGQSYALLLDSKGILLGASNPDFAPPEAIGQPLDPNFLPGLDVPLEAALGGDLDVDRLFVTLEPNERFYFAVPLVDETGQLVLGVAVIYVEHLPTEAAQFSNLLKLMSRSALALLVSAGLAGSLFGFLTAKGMVNRLQHASKVTDAWSQGNFSELIEDPVKDEIGTLGQRLNKMALQLESLLKRREEVAVLEERNRLARDLHDSAKQMALAASFQIGTTLTLYERDPQVARSHLEEAERLVDGVREELTDLIMELRPQDIEEKNIAAILSDYIIDWSHQHDFEVAQEFQESIALPLGAKQTLLRILQEALANIARHSEGTRASIALGVHTDEVALVVEDNGKGFDPDGSPRGVGLKSMRERAEALGGSMVLTSAPGAGTSITIRFPRVE